MQDTDCQYCLVVTGYPYYLVVNEFPCIDYPSCWVATGTGSPWCLAVKLDTTQYCLVARVCPDIPECLVEEGPGGTPVEEMVKEKEYWNLPDVVEQG